MYHELEVIGNLGRDPESRYTPSGMFVCNFSVATSERWTSKDGQPQERTHWWRVAVFGKSGEACNNYLKKGRKVMVKGRLDCDPATGGPRLYPKKDGGQGASFEVTASRVLFLSPKGDVEGGIEGGETRPEDHVTEADQVDW